MSLLHWLDDYLDLENLVTRWGYGGNMPAEEAAACTQSILSAPATYIGATTLQLEKALRRLLRPDEKELFMALSDVMEGTTSFEFLEIRRRMKNDFLPFCAAALQDSLVLERGEEDDFEEDELDQREVRFLENFNRLMMAAQYKMLSRDEWQAVEDHDFTFMMPVEVNWDRNDRELLKRFWDKRPADRDRAAAVADRVLVYHRGMITAKASGLYLDEKVDLLVRYLVVSPVMALMARFGQTGWLARVFAALFGHRVETITRHAAQGGRPSHRILMMHGLSDITDDLGHQFAKVVFRSSLAMLLPNTRAVLRSLFKRIELREPQFKSVVVLYRHVLDPEDTRKEDAHMAADEDAEDGRVDMKRLLGRNIFIKRFADVPIADAEIIFPERTIFLKPVTLLEILSTIVAAIITGITTMWGGRLEWSIAFSAMSILLACGTQVYASAHMQRQQVEHAMAKRLYEITQDAQDGVLHTLLDEMKEQHNKEALLAYTLLLTSGEAMTERELDERCERWLADTFNLKIDFGISDAVEPLLSNGLIIQDTEDKLRALPLEAAVRIMTDAWADYFSSDTYRALHHTNSAKRLPPPTALATSQSGTLTDGSEPGGGSEDGLPELGTPHPERRTRTQSSFQHLATSARNLNRQSTSLHLRANGEAAPWEPRGPPTPAASLTTPLASVEETSVAGSGGVAAFRTSIMSCAWSGADARGTEKVEGLRKASARAAANAAASGPGGAAAASGRPPVDRQSPAAPLATTSPRPGSAPRRVKAGGELSRSELMAVLKRQGEAGLKRRPSNKHLFMNKVFRSAKAE